MDYYQQARPQQVPTPQNSQHYMYTSPSTGANSSQMYYQQQIPSQQPSYQTYPMPAGPANTNLEYDYMSSQHSQASVNASHNTVGNGRGRAIGRAGSEASASGGRFTHVPPGATVRELPLRIVIDARYVGAIIGTGGSNIRNIINDTKSHVIVDQNAFKDGMGHMEKGITILGSVESASKACTRILEVVQREQKKDEGNDPNAEVELKIRAHNQLVGRLIGRQGATIKRIMQETGTTIYVSNPSDNTQHEYMMNPHIHEMLFNVDRTITVKGATIEHVSAAEQRISTKLRQSFESDVQNRMLMPPIPGSIPGGIMMPDAMSYMNMMMRPMQHLGSGSQVSKITKMYVPNNMVGAIIGAKGVNIRTIMRNSGANIRIDGGDMKKEKPDEEVTAQEPPISEITSPELVGAGDAPKLDDHDEQEKKEQDEERLITITGTDFQQWRAQFLIFQRISQQSQQFVDEVKLRIEVTVPSRVVGRIIGKGGQNVRELQRITGASVKIPEDEPRHDQSEEMATEAASSTDHPEGTIVRIVGNFQATQSVQARIGQLINDFNRVSLSEKRRIDEQQAHSPQTSGLGGNHSSPNEHTSPVPDAEAASSSSTAPSSPLNGAQ